MFVSPPTISTVRTLMSKMPLAHIDHMQLIQPLLSLQPVDEEEYGLPPP
jgi:hypothetical protein